MAMEKIHLITDNYMDVYYFYKNGYLFLNKVVVNGQTQYSVYMKKDMIDYIKSKLLSKLDNN